MQESGQKTLIKRLRPKTYSVAVYVVAFFILIELAAVGLIFYFRKTVEIDTEGPELTEQVAVDEDMNNLPAPEGLSRLDTEQVDGIKEQLARLNDEAVQLRDKGDYVASEEKLREALEIQQDHAGTLANLAMLQEAQDHDNKALEYWNQILEMESPEATSVIPLARERVMLLQQRELDKEKALLERERSESVASDDSSKDAAVVQRSEENLPQKPKFEIKTAPDDGLWLKVGRIMELPSDAPEIRRNFDLELRDRYYMPDPSKMRIQVLYYEMDPTGELKPANARLQAAFKDSSPDWLDGPIEVLTTRYTPTEGRRYYGYLLRLYYEDKLQDETANPNNLLRLVPRN
ncbi:MAG: tetratricopeptide repeat protein [Verrucomicrobiota bacterium]